MIPNMIGAYGEWAAQAMQDPARLSFRQPMFGNLEAWRAVARARFREELLGKMTERRGPEHYGKERAEGDIAKAERILREELKRRRWKR